MATIGSRQIYKIFVQNIPWTVGHRELRNYFIEFGRIISANVVFDKKTGCSKGYGFVLLSKATLENIENKPRHIIEGQIVNIQKSA